MFCIDVMITSITSSVSEPYRSLTDNNERAHAPSRSAASLTGRTQFEI
jgi:hypothetical protein